MNYIKICIRPNCINVLGLNRAIITKPIFCFLTLMKILVYSNTFVMIPLITYIALYPKDTTVIIRFLTNWTNIDFANSFLDIMAYFQLIAFLLWNDTFKLGLQIRQSTFIVRICSCSFSRLWSLRAKNTFGKGQLISEWLYDVFNFPKKQCKNLMNFCPRIWKVVQSKR